MLVLPALLCATLAAARDKVEAVTGTVVVLGDDAPLGLDRPKEEMEAHDPEYPKVSSDEAQKAYAKELDGYLDAREDLKAIGAELAAWSPAIAQCAATAGTAAGATATAKITVTSRSRISHVALDKTADAKLAECVRATLEKHDSAAVMHGKDRTSPWTFRFHAAPLAVATPVDVAIGVGGTSFGAPVADLDNHQSSASRGNVSHYYRSNDADVEYGGVSVGLAFSFHPDVGLYAVRIRATGDAATFSVREHTTALLGAPKWDSRLKCWYWRGDRLVYVFEGAPGSDVGQLMVLDIARAHEANVVSLLPGDAQAGDLAPGQRLPKVLLDDEAGE